MDLYTPNSGETRKPSVKYTVKSSKAMRKTSSEDDMPWRTKEEFAKDIIHALDDGMKFLRGEIELKSIDEDLERWLKIAEEMKKNEHRDI